MLKIKSKVFAGLMVALALFVGANFVSADSISLPSTGVKKTSGTVIIKNLQSFLNWSLGSEIIPLVVDGKYGAKTTSAIKKYQANNGLSADGAFGKLSAAKAMALQANGGPSNNGCSAGQMYNSTTGTPCGGSTVSTVPGCTTTSGYSVTTGASCMGGSTNQTGPLTVSLSSNNPATGTIVKGQATADLAHFTFSGTGTISAITLQRSGISDQGTLKNVYLYDGMTRLTDGYSFNNTGTLTMGSLNIPISGTKVISVLADVDPSTTSYNIAVSLTSYTVVGGTTNTVSINGNSMFIATGSNLTAAALSANQIAVGSSPSVNPGTTGFTLWSAPININGNHSLFMKSANFRTIGSAPSDALANIKLYEDGIAVGNAGTMSVVNGSNYIVFDMSGSPIELTTGQHTLDVRADIVKGSARTIQISLQQASDLMLYDSQVGVNVSVTGTPNATANSISISQGTLSIAVDPTFQSLTTVTGGSTNVTIAKFKLHAYGEDVKVNSLDILPVLGGAMSNGLSNVTAYFNGSQVGTQTSSWVSSAINLTPGSQMIVPAGIDSYLEIKSDIRDHSGTNYTSGTIYANVVAHAGGGEGMSSHNIIDIPGATGNSLSAQTGLMAMAKNASFTSQAVSPNASGVKIGSFVLQNQSSSEAVHVTNLQVSLVLATAASTNYTNLKTSETSGNGANPINPTSAAIGGTSTNNFSVDFIIPSGTTKTIDVFADIGSTSNNATVKTTLQINAIGSTSNTTICSSAVTSGSQNGCNTGTALDGQVITVSTGTFGTPAIVVAGSTVAQYISGGTTSGVTDVATAEFKFTAVSGNATISELKFTDTVNAGAIIGVRVGSVYAPMVSGTAYLTGLSIPVAQGGTGAVVDAKISYAPVGSTGVTEAATGSITSLLKLSYVKYLLGGTTSTLCASGCTASTSMPIDSTETMTLVGSAPTVSVAQPSGAILTVGLVEAIDVTVSANTAGPISITSLPIVSSLSGSGTGQAFDSATIVVKDASNNAISLSSSVCAGGTTCGTTATPKTITFATPYTLNAGQSQTFKIFLPIATLSNGATTPNTYLYTSLAASAGFVWTDVAGNASSSTTGNNVTGLIYNYPSTTTSAVHN